MLIFEKRNSQEKVKTNLGKTYDHCKAVLGNCKIDYTVVFLCKPRLYISFYDVNNKQQLRHPFIRLRREGSNETR